MRTLDADSFKRQCARFVLDHSRDIAAAIPQIPSDLSDRAADIWEPLLILADLAGGDWPQRARQAALSLSASAQQSSPIASLLLDILISFTSGKTERLSSRELADYLSGLDDRPWMEIVQASAINDRWLAKQLRPYGVTPRYLRFGDRDRSRIRAGRLQGSLSPLYLTLGSRQPGPATAGRGLHQFLVNLTSCCCDQYPVTLLVVVCNR